MAAKSTPNTEDLVGRVVRLKASDNPKVKSPHMQGRLVDGDLAVIFEPGPGKVHRYLLLGYNFSGLRPYPMGMAFFSDPIGEVVEIPAADLRRLLDEITQPEISHTNGARGMPQPVVVE